MLQGISTNVTQWFRVLWQPTRVRNMGGHGLLKTHGGHSDSRSAFSIAAIQVSAFGAAFRRGFDRLKHPRLANSGHSRMSVNCWLILGIPDCASLDMTGRSQVKQLPSNLGCSGGIYSALACVCSIACRRFTFPSLERPCKVACITEAQQKCNFRNGQRLLPHIAAGQLIAYLV